MAIFSVRRTTFVIKLGLFFGLVIFLTGSISALEYGDYQRISVSAEGTQGNASSESAIVSANGNIVLFQSYATNLTEENEAGFFLFNREIGTLKWFNNGSLLDTIRLFRLSATGRYLLYASDTSTPGPNDLWLRDLQTDTDEKVSLDTTGGGANGDSQPVGITPDGRYAVFTSSATDLVTSMVGCNPLFVRDMVDNTTICVPTGSEQVTTFLGYPLLSGDGSKLYYGASVNECCASIHEIYVYNMVTQVTSYVDITFDDNPVEYGLFLWDVSYDGTVLIFSDPRSENIIPGKFGGHMFHIYDSTTSSVTYWDAFEQTSMEPFEGLELDARPITVSGTGRYVRGALERFTDLGEPEYGVFNFVYDRQENVTTFILQTGNNPVTGDASFILDASDDGSVIVFRSEETTLIPDDTNGYSDIFLAFLQDETPEPTVIELLVNGNFDDNDDANNVLPDGWKKVGLLKNDRVRRDTVTKTYGHSTPNAFQLQGTPEEVGKASKLTRNAKISGVTFAAGDTLTLSAMVDQRSGIPGTPIAKALVNFNNGTQQVLTLKLPNPKVSGYTSVSLSKALKRGDVKSIKVELFYGKGVGTLYIDDVSLTHTPAESAPLLIPVPAAPVN